MKQIQFTEVKICGLEVNRNYEKNTAKQNGIFITIIWFSRNILNITYDTPKLQNTTNLESPEKELIATLPRDC